MILTISCILTFVLLCVQTFFLGGSYVLGIPGLAAGAAGAVAGILLKRKDKYWPGVLAAAAGLLLAGACCVFQGFPAGEGTLQKKEELIRELAAAEDAETAGQLYEEYVADYGRDDHVSLVMARYYLAEGEYDKCSSMLAGMQNRTTIDYYLTAAELYNRDSELGYRLTALMLEAVENHPTWAQGHLILGIAYYENSYDIYDTAAEYYLKKAALLDQEDGYAPCWLGIVAYDNGDYAAAEKYLEAAGERAGDDIYLTNLISYYEAAVAKEVQD